MTNHEICQQHKSMKRINMNRVRSWCGITATVLLLAGFAPASRSALFFSGPFASANWTPLTYDGDNHGTFGFTGSGLTTVLTLQSSTTTGFSDTLVGAVNSGTAATVNFNWTLTANGNLGTPQAYFFAGDTEYDLVGTSGTLWNVGISPGTQIYFELVGDVSPGKSAAQLQISEVPEMGTALFGLLVLGAAGIEWGRRRRMAVG